MKCWGRFRNECKWNRSGRIHGDSVGSVKSMAEKIIHRLENPLTPAANPNFAGQELKFYKKFIEYLG